MMRISGKGQFFIINRSGKQIYLFNHWIKIKSVFYLLFCTCNFKVNLDLQRNSKKYIIEKRFKKEKFMRKLRLAAFLLLTAVLSFSVINAAAPSKTQSVTKEKRRTNFVEIQKRLKNMGYYTGKLDGINGSLTKKAIQTYKNNQGTDKKLEQLLAREGLN